jgi:hypothetical protein
VASAHDQFKRQASLEPGDLIVSADAPNVGEVSMLKPLVSDVASAARTLFAARRARRSKVRVPIVRPTRDGPIRN